jgi:flagellar biogenesis protein FliO
MLSTLLLSEGPDLTRYLLVCAGLIVAIGCAGFGFRRLFAHTLRVKAARRSMQVVDVLPLGGKQRLMVVRCYDRTFLIGLGERETSLVAELDPAAQPEPEAAAVERPAFAATLETVAGPRLRPEGLLG